MSMATPENFKKMSLEELQENHNKWQKKMKKVMGEYGFEKEQENKDDISTFMAKLTYFYYLAMFCWKSLRAYTEKLQDHKGLKSKKKKSNMKTKTRKKA